MNRLIACEMLRSLGVNVVEASDGSEALQLLFDTSVDLVLMDCEMPVMDGYTATQRIRDFENQRGSRRLPIIALTANASEHDEAKTRSVGMDAHIAKPYTQGRVAGDALGVLVAMRGRGAGAAGRPDVTRWISEFRPRGINRTAAARPIDGFHDARRKRKPARRGNVG